MSAHCGEAHNEHSGAHLHHAHTHMSPDDLGGVFKGMSIVLECVVVRREDVGRGFGAVMEGVRRSGKEQVPRSVDGGRRFRVV